MKTRIQWNSTEALDVALRTLAILGGSNVDLKATPAPVLLNAMRSAQEVLPPERRRVFTQLSQTERLMRSIPNARRVLAEMNASAQAASAPAPAPAVEPRRTALDEAYSLIGESFADRLAEALAARMDDAMLDTLADKIAARLEGRVLSRPLITPDMYKTAPKAEATVKPASVRIGVIGLSDKQKAELERSFKDVAFRFYSGLRVQDAPTLDYMIGVVGNIGHSLEKKARLLYKDKYVRANGSNSQLIDTISKLLDHE